jgi:DNA-directed RNA polymerase specialized sigma24 family protein
MDRELFATLWNRAEVRLRSYLAACVMNQHLIDELAQKVALAAWRKRDEFRHRSGTGVSPAGPGRESQGQEPQDEESDRDAGFLAWVLGFARFEVLRGRRDQSRDRHVLANDLLETLESELVTLASELDRRKQALDGCRENLDGRSGKLLELTYGKSLPLAAVAKKVGSSPGAIRTALCRIRDRLRECVERRLAGGDA